MSNTAYGISGQSLYLPQFEVSLEQWCQWTQTPWDKIRKVVGSSFRVPGPHEDAYTMAANAVLRLITQYDIPSDQIGYLALGTESSTDNAVGAVIVKGLVDQGLKAQGRAPLARQCEVPEIKQACLGGVYALKAALRYLAYDGQGKQAIVVSSDIAAYQLGSTGEQTQGAGAVAQWVTPNPTLLEVHLPATGSSSHYRGLDFRKPVKRYLTKQYKPGNDRFHDFPVFNGPFSTNCFVDETYQALRSMAEKLGVDLMDYLGSTAAIFAHRPYQRMPETALGIACLLHMAHEPSLQPRLKELAEVANVSFSDVLQEAKQTHPLSCFSDSQDVHKTPYANLMKVLRAFRDTSEHQRLVTGKTKLGSDCIRQFGNLYSAALPAWLGAGLEDAWRNNLDLAGAPICMLGYGSGDAAEAIPMRVAKGWREAASNLCFEEALQNPVVLSQEQYTQLHEGLPTTLPGPQKGEFAIHHVGKGEDSSVEDAGIDFYQFIP